MKTDNAWKAPSNLPKLRQARREILARIALIEEMRRGSVTRQFLKVRRKGQPEPILTGSYALYTFKHRGRTVGRKLHDPGNQS